MNGIGYSELDLCPMCMNVSLVTVSNEDEKTSCYCRNCTYTNVRYEVLAHKMKCYDCKKEWQVIPIFPPKSDNTNSYRCTECNRMGDLKESIWGIPEN